MSLGGDSPGGEGAAAYRLTALPSLRTALLLRNISGFEDSWRWPRWGSTPVEAFAQLATVARGVRADHPGATWISAGMSADLEAAVANGATHLRVGSAILGSRPPFG